MGRAGLHGTTKTGTTRGAASSGPDQAHEQAGSGGRIRHTTENGTLKLIEKASSCRQMRGHRELNNRGRPGRQLPLEEKQGRGHQRSQVPDQGEVSRVLGRVVPRPPGQHEKRGGEDVDREWEVRSGSTRATWRTCRSPGAPTRAAAPITLYYAHRPPSPGRGLNTHEDKARAGRRGNTW